jgi:hypothetical protein
MRTTLRLAATSLLLALIAAPALAQSSSQTGEIPAGLLAQHIATPSICEPIDELVHGDDWQMYQLTEGRILYMIPCAAGAYNFSYMFYVGTPGHDTYERLLFVDYYGPYGWMGVDQLYNPTFDPGTLTLRSFYKGRGLADCGTSGVWQWVQYGFRLRAFYAQDECNGTIEPGDFPQVWPPPGAKENAPATAKRR